MDYDGTRSSNSEGSVNYSIQEYVNDSISTLVDVSDKNGIPHPNIITESGRALTAHHSVLIFEVLETATLPEWDDEEEIAPDAHELVQELYGIWDSLNQNKMLEAWHDAQQIREEALDLFSHGIVDLKTRAQIERLYWSITREINQIAGGLKHAPDEFRGLSKLLADKYFCNFSLFQSLPDSWAIDQIFPIMPIQRLDEKPERSATLQDITCDSDGKIANFISTRNVAHYLPVHALKKTEPYYVAVFLVGAYQEILGDMHNLFGDTNAVHVSVNEKGYNIEQIIDGETVAEVLDYVQYNPKKLVRTLETWVTKSVKEGKISLEEGKRIPFQLSFGALRIYLFGITGRVPEPDSPFGELIRNQEMREKLTVIKVGGKIVEEEATLRQLLNDFAAIDGHKVLVHGGGRSATKIAAQLGIESKMVNGRRITDAETLKVVTMVYGGLVNKNIVAGLQARGVNALGLTGADMNVIRSVKRPVKEVDYGFVGDVEQVDATLLSDLIHKGVVPVMAPLTHDGHGNMLNTNADTIAGETAKALSALFDVTLVYCFEKKGVLRDENDDDSVIPQITRAEFEQYVADGVIQGGMIPKLENSFEAINAGVSEVVITLASAINNSGGTRIKNNSKKVVGDCNFSYPSPSLL